MCVEVLDAQFCHAAVTGVSDVDLWPPLHERQQRGDGVPLHLLQRPARHVHLPPALRAAEEGVWLFACFLARVCPPDLLSHAALCVQQVQKEYCKCLRQSPCCGHASSTGSHGSLKSSAHRGNNRYYGGSQSRHAPAQRQVTHTRVSVPDISLTGICAPVA